MSKQVTIIVTPPDTYAGSFDIYQFIYDNNGQEQPTPFLVFSNVPLSTLIDPGYTIDIDDNAYAISLVDTADRGMGCSGSTVTHMIDGATPLPSLSPTPTPTPTPSEALYSSFGLLYNFHAVTYNTGGASIAPTGWHIPTQAEWDTLYAEIGYTVFISSLNARGFNISAGGFRDGLTGAFGTLTQTSIWSSSDIGSGNAFAMAFDFLTLGGIWGNGSGEYARGYYLRFIKDSTILTDGQTGTLTDIDGNVYNTICIGSQEWMTSNLKVKHYNNGVAIPEVIPNASWTGLTTGAYCVYYNGLPQPSTTPGVTVTRTPSITPSITKTPSITMSMPLPSISPTPTISPIPPTVLTVTASNITPYSATIGGNVTYQGSSPVVQRGIVLLTGGTPTYDTYNARTATTAGTGSFTDVVTGLTPNTTYNYRAYARNSNGMVGCGTMYQLTTTPAPTPSMTPTPSQSLFGYAATFYGCSGGNCGSMIGTAQIETTIPLEVGKYYYSTDGGAKAVYISGTQSIGGSPLSIDNGPYTTCNEACI